ncbi:PD40 domain-containing protein [Chitinophaga sp. S165]|uniref:PD40 domain-containing protein n=1 Tax=Chitinophaga sp. S165 TaxID=2135462 RepID=UPI000D712515|nr:PD40 domain-containing protein [Chitinophaga sp. S165]PWV46501.1 WD40 repeat protein [Chitinophaga sp. S165]
MKSVLLILTFLCQSIASAQTTAKQTTKYVGQDPPGKTPVKFAFGVVSVAGQHEFGSIFSGDGNECYYAVDEGGKAEIRYMKLTDGLWSWPVPILSDDTFSYNDPMLSPDERKLFFISDKPLDGSGKKKDYDIWYVEKKEDGWSAPINAGAMINSDKHEYYVSFSKSGTMYFSSNRNADTKRTDNFDIYASVAAERGFQRPVPLGDSINTKEYEADVFVAGDESYLIFCATRPDGYGAGDLYISFKKPDGAWTKAKNMGDVINTPGHELCPFVTADGKYFFYTSKRDIYWVDAKIIDDLRE